MIPITPEKIAELRRLSRTMRKQSLDMALKVGKKGSHLGGGLSAIEIFATLYGAVMKTTPQHPEDPSRDRMIVSKGHCVLAYYNALRHAGFLSDADIDTFEENNTTFHGHASRNVTKGIDFSGGSLGMGFSYAVGVAMSLKKQGLPSKVYSIVGDGECDEGIIWEAAMCAAHYHLDNLTLIVDNNELQYDGPTAEVMTHISLEAKMKAFGFETMVVDGHNPEALLGAFNAAHNGNPKAVIANTVKGKGVSYMEGVKEWHHNAITPEQYEVAIEEIMSDNR